MHGHLKSGRRRSRFDRRTFQLANYAAKLPNPPRKVDWTHGITDWPTFLNAGPWAISCCTISAADRLRQIWTANSTGTPAITPDADTLAAYEAVSGYNPADPSTDNGATMLDALSYWRNTGIGSDKILAYAQVPATNQRLVMQALWLFGGLYVGMDLPASAISQTTPGGLWKPANWRRPNAQPDSWGGHALAIVRADRNRLGCVPWGTPYVGLMWMQWSFFYRYASEVYAVLSSQDWAEQTLAPNGFNLAALQADLKKLAT